MGKVWHSIAFAGEWNSTQVEPHTVKFTLGNRCVALGERFPPVPLVRSFFWVGVTFATDRFNILNLLFDGGGERQWFVSSPELGRGGRDAILVPAALGILNDGTSKRHTGRVLRSGGISVLGAWK
ncbi:hypothetical protein TNCV_4953321 [Trichonephila clavipes]|nr:hypothetical protein TNCV_4953321 [Trichonephila clavipes]